MTMNVAYFGEMVRSFGITASDWSGSDGNGNFQYRGVQLDTSNVGNIILPAGAGQSIYGVLLNKPKINESGQVCVLGETKIQLGGTVTVGEQLQVDANGNFIAATSTHVIVAIARMGGASGDIITAFVNGMGFYPHA